MGNFVTGFGECYHQLRRDYGDLGRRTGDGSHQQYGMDLADSQGSLANDTPRDGIFAQRGGKRSRLSLAGVGLAPASSRGTQIGFCRHRSVEGFLVEWADEFEGADHRSIPVGGCSLASL